MLQERRATNRVVAVVVAVLVSLFFVGLGVHMIWQSTKTLPREYDRLSARGVAATAHVDRCATGLGGGRGVACQLTLSYDGSLKTWVYPQNSAQFEGLPIDAPVAMLVDPQHPRTAYTVADVRARTNAGFGIVAAFGAVFVCAGAAGLGLLGWVAWTLRRPRPETEW